MFTNILFNLLDFSILVKFVFKISGLTKTNFDVVCCNWITIVKEVNCEAYQVGKVEPDVIYL